MRITRTLKAHRATSSGIVLAVLLIAAASIWIAGIGNSTAATTAAPVTGIAATTAPAAALAEADAKQIASIRSLMKSPVGEPRAAGDGVWIATGTEKSCIFVRGAEGIGAGCATNENVNDGKLAFVTRSTTGDQSETVGIVPDDVTKVTALDARGDTIDTAAVSKNTYRVSGTGIDSLRLSGTGATSTISR